jgi:5-methylcytosine-specific restriction endonuclease McrA
VYRTDLRTPQWRATRLAVLERDGYVCQVRLPGCRRVATEAHHLDDFALHGAGMDPARLVASCARCNRVLGGRLGRRLQLQAARSSRAW